ncbi:MAG: ferredoxin [Candidatus Bathyarchaeota archaeon B26-1]|nr:MAG: ferredoxin [Candidatus Bathyarchaeota archaeon B26-1]
MKVLIDRENCIGCGVCEALCPEVFEIDEEGLSRIKEPYRAENLGKGEVGERLKSCVEEASNSCPVSAIRVKD